MGWAIATERKIAEKNGFKLQSMSFGAVRKFTFKHKENCEKSGSHIWSMGVYLKWQELVKTHLLHRLPPNHQSHSNRESI